MEHPFSNQIHSTSDIIVTELLSVDYDVQNKSWKFNSPAKDYFKMHFTLKGKYSRRNEKTDSILQANSICFSPPNSHFITEAIEYPTEIIGVFFHAEIPGVLSENIFSSPFTLDFMSDTVKNSFRSIYHIYHLKENNYQLKIKKEIYKIFAAVADKLRNISIEKTNYYAIRVADEYIKENYLKDDISIEYLADLCKITPAYFCRIFKSVFGTSPKKYIIDLKMQTASEYLIFTETPVSEIAKLVGYNEFSYFTTAFKSHFGTTPSEYRKNN